MVASALTQDYYKQLIGDLYEHIEGVDCSGFSWTADGDSFTRARVPLQWTRHLATWLWIAEGIGFSKTHWTYTGHMIFGARYQPDDDDHSQATINAATRAAAEALLSFRTRYGRITSIEGIAIDFDEVGWVSVDISFSLYQER